MINQLTLENYRVIYTTDGREVLSIVERESVDLVILDIMMPEISGYQVCQQVRSVYSLIELPIIMLTAKNQAQHKISSFQAGANDYLMKPFDKPELLARVKTLIRAKRLNQELTSLNTQLEEKVIERTNELKTTNEELTNMNQKLVDMAESKREMLQNIAHELGTPVTLMHSYIQSIQEGVIALDDSQYHELVVDKVNILRRLIQDLYDLALLESQKIELSFRCVSLKMWLDRSSLQAAFTIQQRERRAVIEDIPVDLPDYTIMVDEDRINQVYLNLISNAVKHTDPGVGEIKIRYAVDQSLQQLSIQISDNGTGIEADTLPHIFERFYKGKLHNHSSKEQSIGLGLVIVKEIIRAHQGEIYVTSEINKGTHVTIYLPLQIDDEGGGHNGSVQNISN